LNFQILKPPHSQISKIPDKFSNLGYATLYRSQTFSVWQNKKNAVSLPRF